MSAGKEVCTQKKEMYECSRECLCILGSGLKCP
jgi:hypothetical protein